MENNDKLSLSLFFLGGKRHLIVKKYEKISCKNLYTRRNIMENNKFNCNKFVLGSKEYVDHSIQNMPQDLPQIPFGNLLLNAHNAVQPVPVVVPQIMPQQEVKERIRIPNELFLNNSLIMYGRNGKGSLACESCFIDALRMVYDDQSEIICIVMSERGFQGGVVSAVFTEAEMNSNNFSNLFRTRLHTTYNVSNANAENKLLLNFIQKVISKTYYKAKQPGFCYCDNQLRFMFSDDYNKDNRSLLSYLGKIESPISTIKAMQNNVKKITDLNSRAFVFLLIHSAVLSSILNRQFRASRLVQVSVTYESSCNFFRVLFGAIYQAVNIDIRNNEFVEEVTLARDGAIIISSTCKNVSTYLCRKNLEFLSEEVQFENERILLNCSSQVFAKFSDAVQLIVTDDFAAYDLKAILSTSVEYLNLFIEWICRNGGMVHEIIMSCSSDGSDEYNKFLCVYSLVKNFYQEYQAFFVLDWIKDINVLLEELFSYDCLVTENGIAQEFSACFTQMIESRQISHISELRKQHFKVDDGVSVSKSIFSVDGKTIYIPTKLLDEVIMKSVPKCNLNNAKAILRENEILLTDSREKRGRISIEEAGRTRQIYVETLKIELER